MFLSLYKVVYSNLRSCEFRGRHFLVFPIALQGFRLKNLGCRFSVSSLLLLMSAADITSHKRKLTVAHILIVFAVGRDFISCLSEGHSEGHEYIRVNKAAVSGRNMFFRASL